MGLGSQVIGFPWKLRTVGLYAGLWTLAPIHLSPGHWWTWVLLFFADDLAYYWFHRLHHEVRVLWASHVVHHSSVFYNFSTALRQSWTPMTSLPFWLPLALLGIPPWMIFLQQSISLLYQFFLHTERVSVLPRPIEWIFNTPSHHRVHHGSNAEYLDRNYGGILIVWDRLFGSFEPERPARPLRADQEHRHLQPAAGRHPRVRRDLGGRPPRPTSWRHRLGYVLGRPGWQPAR